VFLKSIDIYGFKTFAEKTSLLFRPGVTAIVGPNGCGKSNIVDAIRWVLGEANARSLRGEVMEDVIFSGSDERKPLGVAEVALTIVNDDALLPIEYSEVTIKRRLYRSGESEFFINKNPVRLRDIHELFADTGIGKSAYSIMEQGNIEVLLSNKPEERMLIFEEAAGITRYKMKIRESYRKLTATEENLVRLDLIINEVRKDYRNLERQAEKACKYRKLKSEEIEYERLYNYGRVHSLQSQVVQHDEHLKKLMDVKKKLNGEVGLLNRRIKQAIERVRKIEGEIMGIRNEIYKKDAALETIDSKVRHAGDRIQEIEEEIVKKQVVITDWTERQKSIERRIKELEKNIVEIQQLRNSQEEKLSSYLSEVNRLGEMIEKNRERIQDNTSTIHDLEVKLEGLREELTSVIDRLIQEIDEVKQRFSGNEKKKNNLVEKIHGSLGRIENLLKYHGHKLRDLEYSVSEKGFKPLVQELNAEIEEIKNRAVDLRGDFDTVIGIQDDLSRVLFGKESHHARKQELEGEIDLLLGQQGELKRENEMLAGDNRSNREKKENFEELIGGLRPEIAANRVQEQNYEENLTRLRGEFATSEEHLQDTKFEIGLLQKRVESQQEEISRLSSERNNRERERSALAEKTKQQNSLIERVLKEIQRNEADAERKSRKIDDSTSSIDSLEIKNAQLTSKIESIYESFNERYSQSLELFKPDREINVSSINEKRVEIRNEMAALGQVNPMAIEEYEEVSKRYEYLSAQRADLDKARVDLNVIVAETLKISKDLFMESFDKVRNNFNNIFRRLFNGGKTDLYLTNEANIFDTGVEILAYPPGKSPKRRSLLSGGEKSMTAIALLFSIFMEKPSPFCMLDEVDHDLDEENVVRFLKLLKEFTDTTQFIIITHNRRTIEFADVIYGVTSEQLGVSKVVSLELMEQAVE
jgi:chromosome segregation protein